MSDAIIMTSKELWQNQAPSMNFEMDEPQLLAEALKRGFVTKVGDDQYQVNDDYSPYNIIVVAAGPGPGVDEDRNALIETRNRMNSDIVLKEILS